MRPLFVLLPLILTGCAGTKPKPPGVAAQPTPTRAITGPTYRTPDGLQMSIIDRRADENDSILGIIKWRFRVTMPPGTKALQHRLELKVPGSPSRPISYGESTIINQKQSFDLLLALYPLGDSISTAPRLRVYLGQETEAMTGVIENPVLQIKDPLLSSGSSSRQDFLKDGSWVVYEFGHSTPNPRNPKIIFRLKAIK